MRLREESPAAWQCARGSSRSPLHPWRCVDVLIICGTSLLLLWGLYDYGAFLQPTKNVVAVAIPVLGLLWAATHPALSKTSAVHWGPSGWFLLSLGVLGGLSATWSLDPIVSLRASGILFGGLFFLILGRHLRTKTPRILAVTLCALAALGCVVSILAIVGYGFRYWRFAMVRDGVLLATGTLGYANALAGMLLLTLAGTAALFFHTHRDGRATARAVAVSTAAGLQLAALALSRSRAAAMILGVMVIVYLILRAFSARGHPRLFRLLGVIMCVLLLCGLAVGGTLVWREIAPQMEVSGLPPADTNPDDILPMTSNSFRVKTWDAALQAARQHPAFGHGLGTFYEAYAPFKLGAHTAYAHNVVIQHAVEVGAAGTLLLLAFLATAVVRSARVLSSRPLDPLAPLWFGILAFLLHNLVDLTWYFPALFYLFALLVGLLDPNTPSGADPVTPATHDLPPMDPP